MHHASLLVANTTKSLTFYAETLGFEIDANRPDLGFPGAWLNVGSRQIHLLELPNPDPIVGRPPHGGRDRHIAFHVRDISVLGDRLTAAGVAFTESRSGRKALFCRDPDGNALEFIQVQSRSIS